MPLIRRTEAGHKKNDNPGIVLYGRSVISQSKTIPLPSPAVAYTPSLMSEDHEEKTWTSKASVLLGSAESAVLVLIGVALVLVAVLLLYSGMHDLWEATSGGPKIIEHKSIEILNTVLLVMMTMEIVYTVAISLKSHTLNAEPFLIIGSIAAIRRMLVITATSTETEVNPAIFHNTLVELGLLAATVVAMTIAICILRFSQRKYVEGKAQADSHS
jgi:phosphate starvation-inducible membrane PsiE